MNLHILVGLSVLMRRIGSQGFLQGRKWAPKDPEWACAQMPSGALVPQRLLEPESPIIGDTYCLETEN